MDTPCRVTADLRSHELQQDKADAFNQERGDWISDRKSELAQNPKALDELFANWTVDYDKFYAKLALVLTTYGDDQRLAVSDLRDYLEDSFTAMAERECDADPYRFDHSDDYEED